MWGPQMFRRPNMHIATGQTKPQLHIFQTAQLISLNLVTNKEWQDKTGKKHKSTAHGK